MMFTGVVRKYSARIMAMTDEKTSVFRTFSLKGYLIIAFMISLGIGLKHIPGIPSNFFAWLPRPPLRRRSFPPPLVQTHTLTTICR